jgi:hypothetical protein
MKRNFKIKGKHLCLQAGGKIDEYLSTGRQLANNEVEHLYLIGRKKDKGQR